MGWRAAGSRRVPMQLVRWSVSLFGTIAIVSAVFAAATIWLLLTDPVTVADAVDTGQVSPLVKELASVLYTALAGLLKYL
jgi:hypothetical protein